MAKMEGTYIQVAYKNVFGYISTNSVQQIGGSTVPTQYRTAYASMLWTLQSSICNRLLVRQESQVYYMTKSHDSYLCSIYILLRNIFLFHIYFGHIYIYIQCMTKSHGSYLCYIYIWLIKKSLMHPCCGRKWLTYCF